MVTWFASEPHFYAAFPPEVPDRFQAVLSADGSVRFHYGFVAGGDGVAGLFPDDPEVLKGNAIATISDPRDPELPGHLDLIEAAIYETAGDPVIVEFTMRDPVPDPEERTRFSYRLALDADRPFWPDSYYRHTDAEHEWRIVLRAAGAPSAYGGGLLQREGNRITMLGEVPEDLRGIPASIIAQVACFDDPRCDRADDSRAMEIELPSRFPLDLSRSERRFTRWHRRYSTIAPPPTP